MMKDNVKTYALKVPELPWRHKLVENFRALHRGEHYANLILNIMLYADVFDEVESTCTQEEFSDFLAKKICSDRKDVNALVPFMIDYGIIEVR